MESHQHAVVSKAMRGDEFVMRVRVEKRSGPSPSPEAFYCYKIWEMRKNKHRTRERTTVWREETWAL